jgi:hypothetical protein
MNRTTNLVGYLPGSVPLTGALSGSLSTRGGGSVTGPVGCSPHVRAIASRPVPTLPIQTKPVRGAWTPPTFFVNKNGKTLSSVSAGVAREARTRARARGAAA